MRTGGQDLSYELHTGPPRTSMVPRLVREETLRYRATRDCPICSVPMEDGRCGEHGMPAEDCGEWLWGGDAA